MNNANWQKIINKAINDKVDDLDLQSLPTIERLLKVNDMKISVENFYKSFEWLSKFKAEKVLEIGCGSAPILYMLQSKGSQIFGIDPLEDLIKYASKSMPAGNFDCTDALNINFLDKKGKKEKFDLILCNSVFQYFDHENHVMESINANLKKLKKGGTFVISDLFDVNKKNELEKIREEFNKKPEETLVLEERLREIRDERRAIKDKGSEIKEDLTKQGMVIKAEKRLLEEEIDKIQDREMDLRDSRGTLLQEIEPIQEKIRSIEGQIEEMFTALNEAYEEKKQTQNELKQVEREIETLAREAESDVLTIISDAMKAAEELENTSPLDFSQFQAIGQED